MLLPLLLLLLLLLHRSRAVEPSSARWRAPSPMDLPFDERSSWINASDRALLVADQSPWPLSSSLSSATSLFSPSALSSRQRKRIVTEPGTDQPDDDPTWIRVVSVRSSCSCESQYEIRDLGDGNYPRYLTASRCKPKTCQSRFSSCRLLHYMVPVLRQRESSDPANAWYPNDDPVPETPLPESLRHQWQLKPISVAVACVSAANTKRN